MRDRVWIIVCKEGFVRALKTDGFQLKSGERAFALDLEIPDAVFRPPSLPTVRMSIPESALITEITVEGEVVEEKALPVKTWQELNP